MKKKVGRKTGHYPHIWSTGPDPRRHDQYYAYLKHKAQASFRGEAHDLTWPQWETLWNTDWAWENRGRRPEDVCLAMLDRAKGWRINNVKIMSRLEQLRLNGFNRINTSRKKQ